MRHAGTRKIETARLLLRRLLPSDAGQMYANWASDPEVTRYLRWDAHKSEAETLALLTAWAELYANDDYYQWCIVRKSSGEAFGTISIYDSLLGESWQRGQWPKLDTSHGVWEPGYCIGREWWGNGYAAEALRAVVRYWFEGTDSGWLACSHASANPASGRVMQKAGFVYDHDSVYRRFDGTLIPCKCHLLTREAFQNREDKF